MLILNLVGVKHKEIFYYLSISLSGPNLRYLRIYSERLIKPDHGMANKVGEPVRNVQDAHRQGMSELLNNLNRGFAPTITNLFQSDNRHVHMSDHRQVHMHDQRQVTLQDQRQVHNPSSSSTDPNPPMAIEPAAPPAEEVVPSKLTKSRKKVPKSEAGLAQARLVANLIDGFQQVRAAHRAQQQADRRLPIEDQAATVAPRGRAPSRAQSSSRDDKTPEYRTKGGQLVMTDGSKRGRSRDPGESRDRDATPEYPVEGTVLLSDFNKKARTTPQAILRNLVKKELQTPATNPKTYTSNDAPSAKVRQLLYSV